MKKFMVLFGLFLLLPIAIFAQGTGTLNLDSYVSSFAVYVVSIGLATNLIATLLVSVKRVFITWGSALVIAVLAFALKLGIFYDLWYIGLIYFAIGGLVSSAAISTDVGEVIIDLLKRLVGKPNTSLKK